MPNTINIVQPKAEDGTEISFITRTNTIYKSDGTPLGDSLDAYMYEVDELSQNLAEYIHMVEYTGTTNNNGALSIPTSTLPATAIVVGAEEKNSGNALLLMPYLLVDASWGIRCMSASSSGVVVFPNNSVTVRIWYVDGTGKR